MAAEPGQAQTAGARFSGQNAEKDRAGLLEKLDAAPAALSGGKTADAIQKLTDLRNMVVTLSQQGGLNPDDVAALISGADTAIARIQSIGT